MKIKKATKREAKKQTFWDRRKALASNTSSGCRIPEFPGPFPHLITVEAQHTGYVPLRLSCPLS